MENEKDNWVLTEGFFMIQEAAAEMNEAERIIAESKGELEADDDTLTFVTQFQPYAFDKREITSYHQNLFQDTLTNIRFKNGYEAIVKIEFGMFDKMIR